MSNAAHALSALGGSPASDYLGPARVVRALGGEVEIELPGGASARARMALAFPYRPRAGDELLVIAKGPSHYVIGVLQGSGDTVLSVPGSLEIRAEGGPLSLSSSQGVEVTAPEVSVDAGKLRMAAESVVQRFTSLYQKVSALWSVRAREAETVIDESSITRAKSASILTEETMSINGKQIHLG
jgi:hypothetical protein